MYIMTYHNTFLAIDAYTGLLKQVRTLIPLNGDTLIEADDDYVAYLTEDPRPGEPGNLITVGPLAGYMYVKSTVAGSFFLFKDGLYLCAEPDSDILVCNRTAGSVWEKYRFVSGKRSLRQIKIRNYVYEGGHHRIGGLTDNINLQRFVELDQLQTALEVRGSLVEIGVGSGKVLTLLGLLADDGEFCLAIDEFDDRIINVTGGRASFNEIENSVRTFVGEIHGLKYIKADSFSLRLDQIEDIVGSIRIFCIDGTHSHFHTVHDMKLAEGLVAAGGVVVLDNITNAGWPGAMEGTARYFLADNESKFVPFLMGENRLWLTTNDYYNKYFDYALNVIHKGREQIKRVINFFGHNIVGIEGAATIGPKAFVGLDPPQDIDVKVDSKTLAQVIAKTGIYWQKIGGRAPYWSVLSDKKYLPDSFDANATEFYESGKGDRDFVVALLRRIGRLPSEFTCCVEFGCGVGRVTAPLAATFQRVIALDISAAHLELAKKRVSSSGASNVVFRQVTAADVMPATGYDLWFSRLVLQHNPPPVTLAVLDKAFAGLPTNGVAIVHVPTHIDGYRFKITDYLCGNLGTDMEMHATPQKAILELAYHRHCCLLDVHEEPGHLLEVANIFVFHKQ